MSNTGHGHVLPRPDGVKARCGGPRICKVCAREAALSTCCGKHSDCATCPDMPLPWTYDTEQARPNGAPQHWIQTLPAVGAKQGGCLDLVNPTPAMIDFRVIATVSSRVPRFGGHTGGGVLSTAQHQTEGARAILRDTGRCDAAAAFLIHDAHEYAIGDIATPVAKALAAVANEQHPTLLPGAFVKAAIASLKSRLDAAIYTAAGIAWPLPPDVVAIVKLYDLRMCKTERDARLSTPPHAWEAVYEAAEPVADVDMYPWSTGSAEAFYWRAMQELLPIFVRSTNC